MCSQDNRIKTNLDESGILSPEGMIQNQVKSHSNQSFKLPELFIFSFFPNLNSTIQKQYTTKTFAIHRSHPYSVLEANGKSLGYIQSGIGAPWASALLEETIVLGAKKIIFFGPCGIIQRGINKGEVILLDSAVRDEGTSSHYEVNGQESFPSEDLTNLMASHLKKLEIPFRKGKTWTTDGLYRETPSKLRHMQDQGCISVDMEASALFSVAQFRKVDIAGLFITFDSIAEGCWNLKPSPNNNLIKPVQLLTYLIDMLTNL